MLQKFLTERAVYLVVCDMSKFDPSGETATDEELLRQDIEKLEEMGVCPWLRYLSWRVPGCDVILVGTKCDLLASNAVKAVASRIDRACRQWLKVWETTGRTVNIEPGVSLTSCMERRSRVTSNPTRSEDPVGHATQSKGCYGFLRRFGAYARREDDEDTTSPREPEEDEGWPCDWGMDRNGASTKSLLYRITHKSDSDQFRGTTMSIPRGWYVALTLLEAVNKRR